MLKKNLRGDCVSRFGIARKFLQSSCIFENLVSLHQKQEQHIQHGLAQSDSTLPPTLGRLNVSFGPSAAEAVSRALQAAVAELQQVEVSLRVAPKEAPSEAAAAAGSSLSSPCYLEEGRMGEVMRGQAMFVKLVGGALRFGQWLVFFYASLFC